MSRPTALPGHKRAHSKTAELPPLKRPQHAPLPTAEATDVLNISQPSFKHIYVVKTEEWNVKAEGSYHDTLCAYVSLQDANWKALEVQKNRDEEWSETYDEEGCISLYAEDTYGSTFEITVETMKLHEPGSAEEPEELRLDSEEDEEDEEEEDASDQGMSEEEDQYANLGARRRGAWQRGAAWGQNCGGCGCGDSFCDSCCLP